MREKHLCLFVFLNIKMSSRRSPMKLRDARADVTPDIPLACKQSTSSVLVPSVSSVQKYKYMLSLLFSRFVHISRTYRTQKKEFQFLKARQCCRVCAGVLPIFAALAPPPSIPLLLAGVDLLSGVCWMVFA